MSDILELQKGIIYGPVNSRRLGRSLGINLLPLNYKLCSFNCVYCHYGWTQRLASEAKAYRGDLPSVNEVEHELRSVLERIEPPAYITFSGNGEPTLHPDFPEIVEVVKKVRDELKIPAKVAILSNSTTILDEQVRKGLASLDVRIMKLDAGSDEVLRRINRPVRGISVSQIVEGLSTLEGVTLQSVFVEGEVANTSAEEIDDWLRCVEHIKPIFVQVYSLENAPALSSLKGVPQESLERIVEKVQSLGIPAKAY